MKLSREYSERMEFFIDTDDQTIYKYLVRFIEKQMGKYSGISLGRSPRDGQVLIWCKRDQSEFRILVGKYMFRKTYAFIDRPVFNIDNIHVYDIGRVSKDVCALIFKTHIKDFLENSLPTSSMI